MCLFKKALLYSKSCELLILFKHFFLLFIFQLDILEPKLPENIYKTTSESNRKLMSLYRSSFCFINPPTQMPDIFILKLAVK